MDQRATDDDLSDLTVGDLGALRPDDRDPGERDRTSDGRAPLLVPESGVEAEAGHLGLTESTHVAAPGTAVGGDHVRPARNHRQRAAQGTQVETSVTVGLDERCDLRRHQERRGAPLVFDESAQLLGVAAADEDVGAAPDEGRRGVLEGADVEQRTGIEEDLVAIRVEEGTDDAGLRDQVRRGEHRPGGPTPVRGRVDDEHGGVRIGIRGRQRRVARGQEALVRVGSVAVRLIAVGPALGPVGVVAQPERGVRGPLARLPDGRPDFGVLPDDDGRPQVVDDERHLLGGMPPVHRAEHGAEPCARQDQFERPVAGLPEPQHPRATCDTCAVECAGEPGDSIVEVGVGHPVFPTHGGGVARTRAAVFGEEFGERRPGADRYRGHQVSTRCGPTELARVLPLIVSFTTVLSILAGDMVDLVQS